VDHCALLRYYHAARHPFVIGQGCARLAVLSSSPVRARLSPSPTSAGCIMSTVRPAAPERLVDPTLACYPRPAWTEPSAPRNATLHAAAVTARAHAQPIVASAQFYWSPPDRHNWRLKAPRIERKPRTILHQDTVIWATAGSRNRRSRSDASTVNQTETAAKSCCSRNGHYGHSRMDFYERTALTPFKTACRILTK